MKAIKENNIEYFTDAKVQGINIDCVQCETGEQKTIEIEAATVVLALGMEANNVLAKELEGKVPIKVVGDAVEARDALEAIREGFLAGRYFL
jgi:NADH dehydrogenase FAD-containing subunit